MVAEYDVITVGGGLAGAGLAKVLAERGVRVLVIEREIAFRDRVRGEQMRKREGLGFMSCCWRLVAARSAIGHTNSSALPTSRAATFSRPRRIERDH
jgi:flavin-dependent dehydrogenase